MSDNYNNQGGGQQPAKVYGPLDESKLRLEAEPQQGSRRKPQLSIKLWENNPRLEVRTGVEGDKEWGKITAAIDMPILFNILEHVRAASEATDKYLVKIVNKKFKFIRGQRSETPLDDTYIVIGRNPETGIVYISVLAYDKERPRIKFDFLPSDFSAFVNADGTPYDKGKLSQFHARGWVTLMQNLIPYIFATNWQYIDYQARKAARQNGGGGGGGYQQGGGYQNRQSGGQQSSGSYPPRGGNSAPTNSGGSNNEAAVETGWDANDDLPM